MASTPENTFIGSVHRHLPVGRTDPYWMKNNNIYTAGIWDVWYSGRARDLWVEYKFITLPKRAKTAIVPDLSALQLEWGEKRYAEGRNLAVIVGCKEGGIILRDRAWEHPITAEAFKAALMDRKEIAAWLMQSTMEDA